MYKEKLQGPTLSLTLHRTRHLAPLFILAVSFPVLPPRIPTWGCEGKVLSQMLESPGAATSNIVRGGCAQGPGPRQP